LLAVLALWIIAYNRRIVAALRGLRLGEMWDEFCEEIWDMPAFGRFTLVTLVLALIYITVYFLIRDKDWRS
jgi:hypothetical protein